MHCSIHRHDKINQTFNNVTGKPTFFFGVRTTKYSVRTTIFWKVVVLRTTTFWSDFYGPAWSSWCVYVCVYVCLNRYSQDKDNQACSQDFPRGGLIRGWTLRPLYYTLWSLWPRAPPPLATGLIIYQIFRILSGIMYVCTIYLMDCMRTLIVSGCGMLRICSLWDCVSLWYEDLSSRALVFMCSTAWWQFAVSPWMFKKMKICLNVRVVSTNTVKVSKYLFT